LIISENIYKDFYNRSPNLLAVGHHKTCKILDCNDTFLNQLGYTKAQILSMDSFFDLYHIDEVKNIKRAFEQYQIQGFLHNCEVILKKNNGDKFYAALNLNCIQDENGINYTRAVWRDINDLVNTRTALQQANLSLHQQRENTKEAHKIYVDFFENAPDMFAATEMFNAHNLKIIACNNAFAEELGYTKEEIYNCNPQDLYAPESREEILIIRKTLSSLGRVKGAKIVLRKKNGDHIHTYFNAVAVRLEEGKVGVIGTWHNLTDLINKQRELQALNQTLMRQEEETKTFIHLLSHDIQSPIRAIDNLAQWIIEECLYILPPTPHANLLKLKGRVKRLENLVTDILWYLQQESSYYEITCLNDIINKISQKFEFSIASNITLQDNIGNFKVDKILLSQVFYNLISNAVKHHHRISEVLLNISSEAKEDKLIFKVTDNGPGIAPQFHEHIFEPLKQLKPKSQVEGSGMGLAIVKKIILAQGGFIKVESQEGNGATFIFSWPRIPLT
jgi:PAS domain S-box-containing protein